MRDPDVSDLIAQVEEWTGAGVTVFDVLANVFDIGYFVADLADGRTVCGDIVDGDADTVAADDRADAVQWVRMMVINDVTATIRDRERRGWYQYQCPVCGNGRPLDRVDGNGVAHWQPCPDHPDGDWSTPILDFGVDNDLIAWLADEVRTAHSPTRPSDRG